MKHFFFLTVAAAFATSAAWAGNLQLVTNRANLNPTDSVEWGQLGASYTSIPSTFSATSGNGMAITGTLAGGSGERRDEANGWAGNFTHGDHLLWTNANGPLTLSFANPVAGAGANVQSDYYGPFTLELSAYDGSTLLGSFTEIGDSSANDDGKAIFLGVLGSTADITKIVFTNVTWDGNPQDFAINTLSLSTSGGVTGAPEPGTCALAGSALLGLLAIARNRKKQAR